MRDRFHDYRSSAAREDVMTSDYGNVDGVRRWVKRTNLVHVARWPVAYHKTNAVMLLIPI